MARGVDETLAQEGLLLVEAGTGVGKSLAYLLPLIKWSVENKKRAVVSTYTKTLQEQLVKKDLPRLQRILDIDFRFALCLGAGNYLCLRRFQQSEGGQLFETPQEKEELSRLRKWQAKTKTGLRSELDFAVSEALWSKVCREGDLCLGKKCLSQKDCFYSLARQKEYQAQILVTNHHLFFSHIASEGKVLPHFQAVVFDEAHTLEDVACAYLGMAVSYLQLKYFCDTLFNPQSGKGLLWGVKGVSKIQIEGARKMVGELRNVAELFFREVAVKFAEGENTIRLKEKGWIANHLQEPLLNLRQALKEIAENAQKEEERLEVSAFILRAEDFNLRLNTILGMQLEKYVYWIEILRKARGVNITFAGAPIDISFEFKKKVIEVFRPIVFTSATLSTQGNFVFLKRRLGMDGEVVKELILDSPFDYGRNVLLYCPKTIPDPNQSQDLYQETALAEIKKILEIMRGRSFILFTSFKAMEKACQKLKEHFKDLQILKQGDGPRYRLLERFKASENSVLLGTNTFWQGIDVPGRALECVIIHKLPFAVPDEPIIEAKMEFLLKEKKDPFLSYQLPQAVIMLRQGFGRLVRTKEDRGMVAILDPRLMTRFYGRYFLSSLPACRRTSDLAEVEKFFAIKL